jgi:4-hydroxy-2-oxoheptanedioate aldolase
MVENALRRKRGRGEAALGAWLSIPSSLSAEAVSRLGFDYVCIDMQHGVVPYAAAVEMLLAIHHGGSVPLVRVPANDFATINRMLDAGALGVVVPMIESAADAREAVRACRYPPGGARSFGGARASVLFGPDYFEAANAAVVCVPMIETRGALDELDAILAVPGVDAVYVGPNDLSLSLGQRPGHDNDGAYRGAYLRVAKACAAAGVVAGVHANARLFPRHVETGYRMVTVSSDLVALTSAAARDLEQTRSG